MNTQINIAGGAGSSAIPATKQSVLLEKWSRQVDVVSSLTEGFSPESKLTLATCLNNTEEAVNLLESTDAGNLDGFKRFALDLVTAVVPNLVAEKLVSVQPIDNKVGVVNYLRYLYGSNKGGVQAGDVFASAIQENNTDMYYSSQEVDAESIELNGSKFEGTMSWLPILEDTIKIEGITSDSINFLITEHQGNLVVVDRFTGKPIQGATVTGTVDHNTGKVEIDVTGLNLDASADYVVNYEYNQQSVGSGQLGDNTLRVPEIEMQIKTIPIIAKSRKLKALYAFDAMYSLQKEYGSDINTLLQTQVAAEIVHEIDGELMNDLLLQAGLTNEDWSRTVPVGISQKDHYESFLTRLNEGSNKIFGATKRSQGNFIVAGLNVSTVIENAVNFQPASIPTGVVGPHEIGRIGMFTVIKNPYYPQDQYVIGYKGNTLLDAGFIYAPYMPVMSTDVLMADDFVGRKGWATSYGKKMVQPLLYCKGRITSA